MDAPPPLPVSVPPPAPSDGSSAIFETLCERLSIAGDTRQLAREHLRALAASDACSCVCAVYLASSAIEPQPVPLPLLLSTANVRFGEFLDLMRELPLASGTEAEVRFRSLEHHVAVLGIIFDKYATLFDKHMNRQRGLASPLLRAFGWQTLAYLRETAFQSAADLLELFRLAISIIVYLGQPPLNLLHASPAEQQQQPQQPIQTEFEALQVLMEECDAQSLGPTIGTFYRDRFLPHVQSLLLTLSITPYDNSAWSDDAFVDDATQKLEEAFASRQHAIPEFDARIFLDPAEAEGLANRLSAQSRNYFVYTPPQLVANAADASAAIAAMSMASASSSSATSHPQPQPPTAPPPSSSANFISMPTPPPPMPATEPAVTRHDSHQLQPPQQPQATFLQPIEATPSKLAEPHTPMRQTISNALWLEKTVENTSVNLQPGLKRYLDAVGYPHETFTRRYVELCNSVDFKTYVERRELAIRFYLYILQEILQAEESRIHTFKFPQLISNDIFHRALLALSTEIVQFCFKMDSNCMTILDALEVKPLELCKLIEMVIRCLRNPPRAVVQRLTAVEETVLQVRAWEETSPIHAMLSKELQDQLLEVISHPVTSAAARSPANFASPISRVRHMTQPSMSARRLQFGAPASQKLSSDTPSTDGVSTTNNNNNNTSNTNNTSVIPAVSVTGATTETLNQPSGTTDSTAATATTAAPPSMPPPSAAAASPAPKHSYTLSYGLQSPQPGTSAGLMSPFRSPRASRNPKENSLELIFRKVVGLAARRARELCVGLQIPSVLFEQISSALSSVIVGFTDILRNRHLDQILICTLYGVCRANKHEMTFQRIIDTYRLQAQASPAIWRDVVLSNKNERGDIIKFYNDIFINRLESFILRFCPPRSTLAQDARGLRTPSRLKPPSISNVPESIPQSPIKIASTHNMYISPISQRTRTIAAATSRFSIGSSPSQELNRINSSMARKRLELDTAGEPSKRRRTDSAGGSISIGNNNNSLSRSSDSHSSSASGDDEDAIREAAISGMEQLAKSPTKGISRSSSWSPSTNKSKRSRKGEVHDSPSQSGNNSSTGNGTGGNSSAASPARRGATSRTSSSSSSNGASSDPPSPEREANEPMALEAESSGTRKSARKRTKRVLAE